ncbi:MAG: cytochrome c oxidase subunit II [Kofleriaceae bacterium]|nr:cytochrome c oxidase subunit II [Kofleriaceae bacterium]
MKSIIRTLAATMLVAWVSTAAAQPAAGSAAPAAGSAAPAAGSAAPAAEAGSATAPAAGSAEGSAAAGSAAETSDQGMNPAPPVNPADKGAAAGQGPQGAGAEPGAIPAPSAASPGIAWYDKLANKDIEEEGTFWMPKSVNAAADDSDLMFYAVLALSTFFFIAIAVATIYFVWKYRHRPGHKAEPSAAHNDAMEITWTVIPTIIVVFLFWYGWRSYVHVVTPPNKAVEINVLAWRWNWQFTHANGVTDSDLHVPSNTPVRLVMTSKDVLHAFYAPAMRVKQDVVPRRYTYAWFYATKPGTYRLTCAEYCGTSHAQMACLQEDPKTKACLRRAVVVVHAPGDYERYLADKEAESQNLPPAELGKKLYEKKGCNACHTVDGTPRVGPSFAHDFGTMVPMSDGSKVLMDESYIRESLMSPQAKSRPGYPPSMPSFEGQLKEKEIEGIIAYIKSLK